MKRNTDAKVKPENKTKEKKAWRFYRSNLSTIVWDKDSETALANFSEGHFTTNNKKVAQVLKAKGYPQIGLNDTSPPNIIINQPVRVLKDGADIPMMGNGINENIAQQRMEALTEEIKAPEILE